MKIYFVFYFFVKIEPNESIKKKIFKHSKRILTYIYTTQRNAKLKIVFIVSYNKKYQIMVLNFSNYK